jgi:phospholipase C
MPPGLDQLKHVVVLMMENRSFDHMLGSLGSLKNGSNIDGLDGTESNPDHNGNPATVAPKAKYQGQLDPDPDHAFDAVNEQIFNGTPNADMKGFINNYYRQQNDNDHAKQIMYYFRQDQLPVLTTLALEFTLFDRWFASIPGPTLCNRAFAHYGTSFGHVDMTLNYLDVKFKSIYSRLIAGGHTAKLYYFDSASSTLELTNLLQDQPQIFGTYQQFLADCKAGTLPEYSFVEPNYSDHDDMIASDQHPDHHVAEGERFIASIYMAIKQNAALWQSTALLVTYDEHGGIFDHVSPPACLADGFTTPVDQTNTGQTFTFNRLGVRVPAVLISPWVPKQVAPKNRVFEHASIPATITKWKLPGFPDAQRSPREAAADTFLDFLTLPAMRTDCPEFE